MHLLILLTQDLSSPSGLGRYFPLAKYLVKSGMRVTILALHADFAGLDQKDSWQDGVHIRYVAQMHVLKRESQTRYFGSLALAKIVWQATRALYREGMKEDADVVLVGKPHPMNGIAGRHIAKKKNVALIVDCDDYEAESNHYSSAWQKSVVRHFEDHLPKQADLVTANTWFTLERLAALGVPRNRLSYLPNGVDSTRFTRVDEAALDRLRASFGLSGSRVVAYMGSLNLANHPVDLLVRSFQLLHCLRADTRLLVVGGGKDFDALKRLVESLGLNDFVTFTGRIPPGDMAAYYQLADVTVDPVEDSDANRGRCPLKLFESWLMGVPFVTADVGDRRILAGDPPAALLAQPGSVKDLAAKIQEILDSPELASQLAETGLQRSAAYDWAKIAAQAYQQIEATRLEQPGKES